MSNSTRSEAGQINYNDYQAQMLRSALFDEPFDRALALVGLGLVGEAGEICDLTKKIWWHGHSYNQEKRLKLLAEDGDVAWYAAYLARVIELDFQGLFYCQVYRMERARLKELTRNFIYGSSGDLADNFWRVALSLGKKAGEVVGQLQSFLQLGGHQYEKEHLRYLIFQPLAELVAHLVLIAEMLDANFSEVLVLNIEKLNRRYPTGFSSEASQARADVVTAVAVTEEGEPNG